MLLQERLTRPAGAPDCSDICVVRGLILRHTEGEACPAIRRPASKLQRFGPACEGTQGAHGTRQGSAAGFDVSERCVSSQSGLAAGTVRPFLIAKNGNREVFPRVQNNRSAQYIHSTDSKRRIGIPLSSVAPNQLPEYTWSRNSSAFMSFL
ncbi:hypothetical protein JX266_010470 [Neoarthrinium moseri]|nr:hypothetical protein JX266_010470 [Neoarthrinium moseri]